MAGHAARRNEWLSTSHGEVQQSRRVSYIGWAATRICSIAWSGWRLGCLSPRFVAGQKFAGRKDVYDVIAPRGEVPDVAGDENLGAAGNRRREVDLVIRIAQTKGVLRGGSTIDAICYKRFVTVSMLL